MTFSKRSKVAVTLEHQVTPPCIGLSLITLRNRHPVGPKVDNALTLKPDQSIAAAQEGQAYGET